MPEKIMEVKCERIWVGKFVDDNGTFEILVPSCDRIDATENIKTCLENIKSGKISVTQKIIGEPKLLFIDEVGPCDYIRE